MSGGKQRKPLEPRPLILILDYTRHGGNRYVQLHNQRAVGSRRGRGVTAVAAAAQEAILLPGSSHTTRTSHAQRPGRTADYSGWDRSGVCNRCGHWRIVRFTSSVVTSIGQLISFSRR